MGSAQKSYHEINEKIRKGQAVVVTAEEMIGIVRKKGPALAAREVDVVTTGTFAPMCSSGVFINFGHTQPPIKASKVWLNDVPAYGGLAAVDIYLGATEPAFDDPLNKIKPGTFEYGGGHVIHDLVSGKPVRLRAEAYGTDCYPNRHVEMMVTLKDLPYAVLCNPRNAYQNYNCAVNLSNKTIFTYMGTLKPRMGNANYSTSGQLSPLLNDPYYKTLGLGTRIFLGGGQGYIVWSGSQHNPGVSRLPNGVPRAPAGTIMVLGDLKQMHPRWLMGVSFQGYGCSLAVGLGVPIPILDERMAAYTAVSDEEIVTQVKDYSFTRSEPLCEVTYAQLRSGSITVEGKEVHTVPLSSYRRAAEIADTLKHWIQKGDFLLGEPQMLLPSASPEREERETPDSVISEFEKPPLAWRPGAPCSGVQRHGAMNASDRSMRYPFNIPPALEQKCRALEALLPACEPLAVAYSGGVDSTFLTWIVGNRFHRRVVAILAVTPFLGSSEHDAAVRTAEELGFALEEITLDPSENPAIRENSRMRCYHCKKEIMSAVKRRARELHSQVVMDGTHAEDGSAYRPGRKALAELEIVSPLAAAGFSKSDIRELSRLAGLSTWDKPSQSCLATRLPYGMPITHEQLSRIDRAEMALRVMGFGQVRVRVHGELARIELQPDAFSILLQGDSRETVLDAFRRLGFNHVCLDLAGYRSGSWDEGLKSESS